MNITPEGLIVFAIGIIVIGGILWTIYEDPDDPKNFDTYF